MNAYFRLLVLLLAPLSFCQADERAPDACHTCVEISHEYSKTFQLQNSVNAGFEFTFLKPRFSDNVAFTAMQADGASFESFRGSEFEYDLELSPRAWLSVDGCAGLGLRATYWQLDQDANAIAASPPANGFGRIDHPSFGDIDISTTIPGDRFVAMSGIEAYSIDLEATKQMRFNLWAVTAGTGVRYASVEQSYLAELTNSAGTRQGQIDFQQNLGGFGPTISLNTARPLGQCFTIFGKARGSLLWGDGTVELDAGEDLDLTTPFRTDRVNNRDDILPITEIQVGLQWLPPPRPHYAFQPFFSAALEGQLWSNAGNATTESGDLGFFGFNVGIGFSR